jgi:tetratricopeptide (TPR) repeat protein
MLRPAASKIQERGLKRAADKMHISFQFRLGCLILLSVLPSGKAMAQSDCAPPESMKAKFAGTPDVSALNDLGVWFGEQKNYSCAAKVFATSLQMDPKQKDMSHVAFMFGASLYHTGDTKEAIPALREAEEFGYRGLKLHQILAQALDDTHATPDAEAEWRAALEIDPEYTEALDSLSDDLLADHNNKGVIELLDKPRIVPQWTVRQAMNLGRAYALEGKPQDAERILRDALNTYPDDVPLATQLAEVLTQSGKKTEAEAVLRIVNTRHSGGPETEAH